MVWIEEDERKRLWQQVADAVEDYFEGVGDGRVTPELDPERIRELLEPFDFATARSPHEVVHFVVDGLRRYQTHTPHPRYYGLFNPAPTPMGVAADTLAAAFNPQLAAWSHSPLAIEMERHLARAFGGRFGLPAEQVEGTFTSGGAEANHTALLVALTRAFPELPRHGLRALRAQPVLYLSSEGHHSVVKAARMCGLGGDAVREVRVDDRLRLRPDVLRRQIDGDRQQGLEPFLVVATAGSTGAGAIDPLREVAQVASDEGLWLHVDAAWGGAAALVPELATCLEGIERADSITFDAHKWLSVPMGAGLFLTRHPRLLPRMFRVAADYMPKEAGDLGVLDPYAWTMQWSRRFIGLKVFLSLAVAGWGGYERVLRHQTAMGDELRRLVAGRGWKVVNHTRLPVVCFADGEAAGEEAARLHRAVALDLVRRGEAWISSVRLGPYGEVLRACITNFRTTGADLAALADSLDAARDRVRSSG